MKEEIRNYYSSRFEHKVFHDKKTNEKKDYYILYLNNFADECNNFTETFVNFLPAYVKSDDYLDILFQLPDKEKKIIEESKKIWDNSKTLPHRDVKIDGLYGELFLDFYSRVVNNNKFFITYASKRPYNMDVENYGYDQVYYQITEDNKLILVIAEAKFVASKNACYRSFLGDINGSERGPSHLTKEYFDDYVSFILDKGSIEEYTDPTAKNTINKFVNDLNKNAILGNSYLQFIINKQIQVKLVYFAIFSDQNEDTDDFIDVYLDLEKNIMDKLKMMGILNYKIEIVFIPTKSTSMKVKGEIKSYYE